MGNVQELADGGVFIGWGTDGSFSEFGPDGDSPLRRRFGDGSVTYRAFRFGWSAGRPERRRSPSQPFDTGTMTVYASWNGADRRRSLGGARRHGTGHVMAVGANPRTGFETPITVPRPGYVTAVALDGRGRRLGAAPPLAV